MGQSRQAAIDDVLPALTLTDLDVAKERALPPSALFADAARDVVLEIGFGNGEHLKEMMVKRPDRNYIGAEPFINGMSAFLKSVPICRTAISASEWMTR